MAHEKVKVATVVHFESPWGGSGGGGPARGGDPAAVSKAGGKLPEILFRQIYKINPTKGAKRR